MYSDNCVITESIGAGTFARSNTKLYVAVVTLSTQDNVKLQKQFKQESRFKQTRNWKKYQSKVSTQAQTSTWITLLVQLFKDPTKFIFYCLKIIARNRKHKKLSSKGRKKKTTTSWLTAATFQTH